MVEEIKPNQIYTPKETRDFLKVSDSTMKRMIKNGVIKAYKVSGQYRIWGYEVLKLVSPGFEKEVYKVFKKIKDKAKQTINRW